MTREYPRARDLPRAGFAAGPCLFKDTMQLSAYHNNSLFLGHAAMLVNEGLPHYLVRRVAAHFDLRRERPAILGMAFKGESDDPRDSLAFKLRKTLEIECSEVLCTDAYINDPSFVSLAEALERGTLFFIGAPHQAYRDLAFGERVVIDIWRHTTSGVCLI
jgi:UDP-N-acetyl-D-mannosaminuronic acid dehydrogenase